MPPCPYKKTQKRILKKTRVSQPHKKSFVLFQSHFSPTFGTTPKIAEQQRRRQQHQNNKAYPTTIIIMKTSSSSFRIRPSIILFGDSITEQGFGLPSDAVHFGWASLLAADYARRADVFNRGFSGYTSRHAVRRFVVAACLYRNNRLPLLYRVLWGQ